MKIYHYHPDTGVLLGEGIADASPLEQDVWLVPASATTIEPPQAPVGSQVVFSDGAWQIQDLPKPEPAPEPVIAKAVSPQPLTTEERLAQYGFTVDELRSLMLGLEANQ